MKLFEIYGDYDRYDTCDIHIAHGVPFSLHQVELDGSIQGDNWIPRIMVRHKKHPLGDYVNCHLGNVLILTNDAIEKLRPTMGIFEILQLYSNYHTSYSAVNILTVLDCVNYEKAKFSTLPATKENQPPRIIMFDRYSFHPHLIGNNHIFRLVNHPKRLYVDDVFVNEVEKLGLTGFSFDQIWDSEAE